MTVFSKTCQFPGTAPIQDATNGWDAVYAVAYSTINADLAIRQPWLIDLGGAADGTFDQSDGPNSVVDAAISGLAVATGGTGRTLVMTLSIASLTLVTAAGSAALAGVAATVRTGLAFSADPAIPGLHNLRVDTTGLTVTGAGAATSLTPAQSVILQSLLQSFVAAHPDIFAGVFANVFTKDYAESVDIPWLLPTRFDYALADKIDASPPTDGILAVLASVGGDVSGLSAQVNPGIFPTNPGVNAAAAISSTVVATDTFVRQLNSQLDGALTSFAFDTATNTLSNQQAISAYYRIDSTTGAVSMIPASDLADDGSGATYPFSIPAGALSFTFAADAIAVAITDGVVTLDDGYTQTIQLSSSYQLVVDDDQTVDLVLSGAPVITSSLNAPDNASVGSIARDLGITCGSIVIGEAISFAVDRFTGFVTNTAMSNDTYVDLIRKFFAAERQIRKVGNSKVPVRFSIKGGRTVIMSNDKTLITELVDGDQLQSDYVEAVTLDPEFPFKFDDRNKFFGFSKDLIDLLSEKKIPQPALLKSIQNEFSNRNLNGSPTALNIMSDNVGRYLTRLNQSQREAFYKGCISYINDATNSGKITYDIYGTLVARFPEATQAPALSTATQPKSVLAGDGLANDWKSAIRIQTSDDSTGTDLNPGLFQDIKKASRANNYGAAAAIFKDVIQNTKRPVWVKATGVGLYVAGLALGYYAGQAIDGKLNAPDPEAGDAARKTAQDIATGGSNGPSTLLFSAVSFPFMERFSSGAGAGGTPIPANVLQCAAVNGGLVLGVAIALDQK